MELDPAFEAPLRASFDLDLLEASADVIYGLWPDYRLAFFNSAWTDFARANDGQQIRTLWGIGRNVMDATPPILAPVYVDGYEQTLASEQPWQLLYECHSPSSRRDFMMRVYPIRNRRGLLVVNSLLMQTARPSEGCPPTELRYRDANGLITQCAHCRRTRRPGDLDLWDWVPEWVSHFPENTSHGLCAPCLDHHYAKPVAS